MVVVVVVVSSSLLEYNHADAAVGDHEVAAG